PAPKAWPPDPRSPPDSRVMADVQDVAVSHNVLFPLKAQPAGGTNARLILVGFEIADRVDLGANETLLEVGVNHTSRLRRGRPHRDRPCANLLLASRKEGL